MHKCILRMRMNSDIFCCRSHGDDLGPGAGGEAQGAGGELPGHAPLPRHPETHRQRRGHEETGGVQKRFRPGRIRCSPVNQ